MKAEAVVEAWRLNMKVLGHHIELEEAAEEALMKGTGWVEDCMTEFEKARKMWTENRLLAQKADSLHELKQVVASGFHLKTFKKVKMTE